MPAITVRNLSEDTHRALKARAIAHGRSTEAEVRDILDRAAADRPKLGSLLASIGAEIGGVELDITRKSTSSEPIDLS